MKKRINIQLTGIAVIAILMTSMLVGGVFYELFQKQIMEDLRTTALILKSYEEDVIVERILDEASIDNLRITLIESDGTVLYDTNVRNENLDNHSTRPEIREAFEKGEGQAIRRSSTLGKDAFYYAVKMDNETVLRVSKETNNIFNVFFGAVPIVLFIVIILFVLCSILAHYLTKKIVRPIEELADNLDSKKEIQTYPELRPFMDTIKNQHDDIIKGAQMRQDFTANVSHELKTPLTSISGYSEFIENGMATDADITRFAHEIHKNATRLLTLINDIIRLSELDTNDRIDSFEKVNLHIIAQNCVEMLQMNASNHKVTITFSGEPAYVYATKEMMEELLYNLCDNAIRYNCVNGTVHVAVKNNADNIVLSVKDTGIGIPKEHQERIFERFYRVDKSRSQSTGGTGLGLAIVKHIVAKLNATMELSSEPGKGTEIQIFFPIN